MQAKNPTLVKVGQSFCASQLQTKTSLLSYGILTIPRWDCLKILTRIQSSLRLIVRLFPLFSVMREEYCVSCLYDENKLHEACHLLFCSFWLLSRDWNTVYPCRKGSREGCEVQGLLIFESLKNYDMCYSPNSFYFCLVL